MAKLSKDKRDRLILVMIGTIAVLAGLWYGVIKTRQEAIEDNKRRLLAAIDNLDKATKRVKQAEKVEAELEAATRKLKAIEDTMASGADYSWALLLLEKARAGHDVNIIDVTRPAKGDVGVLAQFPYDAAIFSVRGTAYYHQFGKFLADFENRFPYFRVQNLSLGAGVENVGGTDGVNARAADEKLTFRMEIIALIKPTQ
jgi:hypothetical protein